MNKPIDASQARFDLEASMKSANEKFMTNYYRICAEHGWMENRLRFFRDCLTKTWPHHASIDLVKEITELIEEIHK